MLSKVLNNKFSEAVQKDKERKSEIEETKRADEGLAQKATSFMSNFKGIKSAMFGEKDEQKNSTPRNKTQTMRIPKILAQNIIFNTISNFIFHFINFNYSLRKSKEVVLFFCKRYELDQSRTHLLLSELESAQNQMNLTLQKDELRLISINKKRKREGRIGPLMIL